MYKTQKIKQIRETCCSMFRLHTRRGFSLLELLIVISIMAILSSAGVGYYQGFIKKVEIQTASKALVSDLRQMRSKSMIGDANAKWGVRMVNVSGGNHYYELFSTPTNYTGGAVESTVTLPFGVTFSSLAVGASQDVIFSKISGTTTPVAIVLMSQDSAQTITVSSIGTIY